MLPLAIALAAGLSGCSVLAERLANGGLLEPNGAVVEPNGTVIEPNGTMIEPSGEVIEPRQPSAIETVITGLSEAQQVRTLTRQLAR